MLCSESLRSCQWVNFSHSCSHPGGVNKHVTNHHHILIKMLGYQNGNLSDSSSDTSAASHRTNNHEGCLVNADLNNLNLSINSDQGQDSQTLEILRLRAENAELKRRLREAQSSDEESDDAEDLNKTLSLESLIVALQNEYKRSPNTERKLSGLKQALEYKKWCNFSTKEAVAHVLILSDLSPGNSPEH